MKGNKQIVYLKNDDGQHKQLQCWIDNNEFLKKLKQTDYLKIVTKKFNYSNYRYLILIDRYLSHFHTKMFLNCIGSINMNYFNLKTSDSFSFFCDEESIADLNSHIDLYIKNDNERIKKEEDREKVEEEKRIKMEEEAANRIQRQIELKEKRYQDLKKLEY